MLFGQRFLDAFFVETQEGRAFYPYGALGSGFLVTRSDEAAIRARLDRWYSRFSITLVVQIMLSIFVATLPSLLLTSPVFLFLFADYYWALRVAKKRWPKATTRITVAQICRAQGIGISRSARIRAVFELSESEGDSPTRA